jgi:tRNA dimethylallyltransferase
LIRVPVNKTLRGELGRKSMQELGDLLASFKNLHNKTDTGNRKRLIRALEIEYYYRENPELDNDYPDFIPLILGISFDRDTRRKRISQRLAERMKQGMVEEVEGLLKEGIPAEKLIYYGLEYKYITEYLRGDSGFDEMLERLEIAIHQFAKRQMTWFRGMERRGLRIHWIEGQLSLEEKLQEAYTLLGRA